MQEMLLLAGTHKLYRYPGQFHVSHQKYLHLEAVASPQHVSPSNQYCNMDCRHPETRVNV